MKYLAVDAAAAQRCVTRQPCDQTTDHAAPMTCPANWMIQRFVVTDERPPFQPGERIAIAATKPDHDHRGRSDNCSIDCPAHPEYGLVLHPGHIVGTATVDAVLPIHSQWDPSHDCHASVEVFDRPSPGDLPRGTVLRHYDDREPDDITDDIAGAEPGRWAVELVDAAPTTERCPALCLGGGDPLSIEDHDPESDWYGQPTAPCPTCGGARSCPPVPFMASETFGEWTP